MCVDTREEEEAPTQDPGNPFTVPVAMLFYRVAKNMRASEDANKKIASIRALLKNSLTLLDKDKFPKVVLKEVLIQLHFHFFHRFCLLVILRKYGEESDVITHFIIA